MLADRELLTRTYDAFNARDVEAALAAMHPDVDWPNGMEGGRVHGHRSVRDYWTRQWRSIDPRGEPRGFAADETGRIGVDVHQGVRDRQGHGGSGRMGEHGALMEGGLIPRQETPTPGGEAQDE